MARSRVRRTSRWLVALPAALGGALLGFLFGGTAMALSGMMGDDPAPPWTPLAVAAAMGMTAGVTEHATTGEESQMPSREDALELLHEWVDNENLRNHMRAVEAAVRSYARDAGQDEELWGLAGLLHDLDWEKYPDEHPLRAGDALRERGYPDQVVHAILAHRSDFTGVEPVTDLDRTLVACDEITGLITATALVRPNGIDDLKPKSVRKKMKDPTFARGVDRADVERGAELLGVEMNDHIQKVIDAMRGIADDLGLSRGAGEAP